MQQAKQDIDSVFSMGLFEDVKFLPQASESSTLESPVVDLTLQVKEKKPGGLSAGFGMSAQVKITLFACHYALDKHVCCMSRNWHVNTGHDLPLCVSLHTLCTA